MQLHVTELTQRVCHQDIVASHRIQYKHCGPQFCHISTEHSVDEESLLSTASANILTRSTEYIQHLQTTHHEGRLHDHYRALGAGDIHWWVLAGHRAVMLSRDVILSIKPAFSPTAAHRVCFKYC